MSESTVLDYDKFVALEKLSVCAYMEPFVNERTVVGKDVLDQMLINLPTYDEYHLVYAIEIGAKHDPDRFAPQLPVYLAHEQGSVWSAAMRNLIALSDRYVTQGLVNSVRNVYSKNADKKWIRDVLDQLESRLREKRSGDLNET